MVYLAPIRSEQYPATDETQCIELIIPAGDEFKALAYGLLNKAADVNYYDDPDSAQTEGLAAIWDTALYLTEWTGCMQNTQSANNSLIVFGDEFLIDTGNGLTINAITQQMHNFYVRQLPSANGDIRYVERYLVAGEWTSRILVARTNASAKMLPQIHDADENILTLTERDLYVAVATYNNIYTDTFTLAASGLSRLIIGANGKNASSSGYDISVTAWTLYRTG